MPSPTAASAMPMRRTWLTNVASPNGSAMRSSSTTWPGEQSMERSTRARRAYKAMQTWPCRRVKGDWRRRLGHGGPHACRSGVLGGPRTVRTDLFAAIALPVLTLFVLLYTASLLAAVMHPSCGRLGCRSSGDWQHAWVRGNRQEMHVHLAGSRNSWPHRSAMWHKK